MSFKVVIPARYASTRLPAKALADIGGRPMVQWVVAAAGKSGADEVLVATDDERVAAAAIDRSGRNVGIMTRADHQSGTDRIAEVATQRGWSDDTIVVNVQGDEPKLPSVLIDQVAELLAKTPAADIATLSTPITSLHEFLDPNVVKVVTARSGLALYFSRAPIPWHRDGASRGLTSQTSIQGAQRHLGIYAYRVAALRSLTAMPPSDLEMTERLEQLRALQTGMQIAVSVASEVPGVGVDTPEDLERVRAQLHPV
ncbi:3-deoxy-manno-octulosonate cytidylyltransferase [Povalibacter sp.]|uniref:3-deoxy-manno-octulosonate cytidylyltransferase n=1 Tax=Povalibacter sp. TaxID=1962978 RepID=UPI002F41BF18